jgi:hypothetical protein
VKPLVKLDLVFGTTNGARYGGLKRVLFDVVAGWLSVPSDRAEHARTPTLLMPFSLDPRICFLHAYQSHRAAYIPIAAVSEANNNLFLRE